LWSENVQLQYVNTNNLIDFDLRKIKL